MDTIQIANEYLDLLVKNDTLIVKTIVSQNNNESNSLIEVLKTILPVIGTLFGLYLGYKLNKLRDEQKEFTNNLNDFRNELVKCDEGNSNYNSLLISYSKLSKKDKQKYSGFADYEQKNSTEKHELIKKLLSL